MAQASASSSSNSSKGTPMLPARAVRRPAARNRCASSDEVVLLPLVPVTQIVLAISPSAPARSPNHKPVPPMKRVPAAAACSASGLYGLMPGDFTTTSNAASRSPVATCSMASNGSAQALASAASASLQNSVSGCCGRRARNAA